MADNDQLLHKFGNLIDQKLEPIKKDMASKQDIQRVEQVQKEQGLATARLEQGQTDLKQGQKNLEQGQIQTHTTLGQLTTAVEAISAGQKELQETLATRADVLRVGVKVDSLRKRIEGIEEQTGSTTHKN